MERGRYVLLVVNLGATPENDQLGKLAPSGEGRGTGPKRSDLGRVVQQPQLTG